MTLNATQLDGFGTHLSAVAPSGNRFNNNACDRLDEIIGSSAAIKQVIEQIKTVSPTNATVLLQGETGVGKEVVARAIHRMSSRSNHSFVSMNCAAFPAGLLESELFGYDRGAFTGAIGPKIGRFEMAHRGTLFLDEVGDIPLELQPKLLRALQEKSFERLGGTKTIPIDCRLLSATNRNLGQMMKSDLFRSDLYYRLRVFPITIPPLRERPADIVPLVEFFTRKYSREMARTVNTVSSDTLKALLNWHWPGNVRELEHFIQWSVILSHGSTLNAPLSELQLAAEEFSGGTMAEMERDYILRVLDATNGVIKYAAIRLGMPRTTLNAMMRRLGISRGRWISRNKAEPTPPPAQIKWIPNTIKCIDVA